LKSWLKTIGQESPNLMKNSTFLGSILSVLLAFSVISEARTYIQPQDPKPVQQTNQPATAQNNPSADVTKPENPAPKLADSPVAKTEPAKAVADGTVSNPSPAKFTLPVEVYSATAYSLRGRTASGRPVSRGIIAADPRFLPIGSRVHVEAGAWSGEYVVADTGGSVRGRRIDIWTPTSGEAMRFGRRAVRLTILELAGKHGRNVNVTPRVLTAPKPSPPADSQTVK